MAPTALWLPRCFSSLRKVSTRAQPAFTGHHCREGPSTVPWRLEQLLSIPATSPGAVSQAATSGPRPRAGRGARTWRAAPSGVTYDDQKELHRAYRRCVAGTAAPGHSINGTPCDSQGSPHQPHPRRGHRTYTGLKTPRCVIAHREQRDRMSANPGGRVTYRQRRSWAWRREWATGSCPRLQVTCSYLSRARLRVRASSGTSRLWQLDRDPVQ